jgi:hypothetical protein
MRRFLIAGGSLGAVALLASVALATHSEPQKAKSFKGELVAGYNQCTTPNDTAGSLAIPACSPPVRNDDVCSFGPKGKGKVSAAIKGKDESTDLKLQFNIKDIQGCEGEVLCPVASIRVTTDNCASGIDCTTVDLANFPVGFPPSDGCCTVDAKGNCKIKIELSEQIPGALEGNNNTGIELLGCGVSRTTGTPSPTGPSFTCGLLAP